jgi:hypothetical protein
LSEFDRKAPLTKTELIRLYQIQLYLLDQFKSSALSKPFTKVIPKPLLKQAEESYLSYDLSL